MKAVVDVVTITPKKATEYLENLLDGQRKVRETWVKSLADDMRHGRFRLSSDALVLIKGKLGNGQHRLWAVVESDRAQPFILMRTDDEELYKVLDTGAKRTVADALGIINGNMVTAIANLALGYDKKLLTPMSYAKKISRVELIEYVEKNAEALQDAGQLGSRLTSCHLNLVAKSVPSAFAFLARRNFGQRADEFLMHVYSGDQPDGITSILRDRYLKSRVGTTRNANLPSQMALALMIKAFNVSVKGTTLSKSALRMQDGEAYPQIMAS